MTQERDVPVGDSEAVAPDTSKSIYTTVALGGIAAVSLAAEQRGLTHDLPTVARLAVESGAHPLLGYVGAWAANSAAGNPVGRLKTKLSFAGATATNFLAETAQSALIASPQYVDFMSSRNLPETAKDYAFALVGMGLYLFENRKRAGQL